MSRPLRFLFFKPSFAWPFESGHDVHTFHMMKALAESGHRIGLVTTRTPRAPVLDSLALDLRVSLDGAEYQGLNGVALGRFEERFRSYWGVPVSHVSAMKSLTAKFAADAVVVSGLEVLPMIGAVEGALRIWYAADEWVLHHMSQVQAFDARSWHNVKDAAVKGLYERAFRHKLDRAWAVTDADRRALRWIAGVPSVDVLPNGIDADQYRPTAGVGEPATAVFWGRLDFGPNIQALEWFCSRVWPLVLAARPDARFTIIGFKPTAPVMALGNIRGVTIRPDVPDIRPEVAQHSVVVLPFVSGVGIKNKLLEAAAMGKAVVCTRRAVSGLRGHAPFRISDDASQWPAHLLSLWADGGELRRLGEAARQWVMKEHTWAAAAATAVAGVEESLRRKSAS